MIAYLVRSKLAVMIVIGIPSVSGGLKTQINLFTKISKQNYTVQYKEEKYKEIEKKSNYREQILHLISWFCVPINHQHHQVAL